MIHETLRIYYAISIFTALVSISFYLINTYKSRSYKCHPRYRNGLTKDDVTVIMPVYNEDMAVFENSMRSAAGQCRSLIAIGPHNAAYASAAKRHNATFVAFPGSKRAALSEAIGHVKTEHVLFLDSDTEVPSNAVESMLSLFNDSVGGVGVNAAVRLNRSIASYCSEFFQRVTEVIFRTLSSTGRVLVLDGRCAMYRTGLVRPFMQSEQFRSPRLFRFRYTNGDDFQMTGYAVRSGYKVLKDYDIKAITEPQESLSKVIKQLVRWTRSSYLSFFRELDDGTLAKSGAFYTFNVCYAYIMPLLVLASFAVEIGYLSTAHVSFATFVLHKLGLLFYLNFKRLGYLFISLTLLRLMVLVSIALFTIAIADRMSEGRKIRTLLSGGVVMSAMLFISIYCMLTFWKQDEWLTR